MALLIRTIGLTLIVLPKVGIVHKINDQFFKNKKVRNKAKTQIKEYLKKGKSLFKKVRTLLLKVKKEQILKED